MKQNQSSQIEKEDSRAIMDEFFRKRGIPNATKEMEGKARLTIPIIIK